MIDGGQYVEFVYWQITKFVLVSALYQLYCSK